MLKNFINLLPLEKMKLSVAASLIENEECVLITTDDNGKLSLLAGEQEITKTGIFFTPKRVLSLTDLLTSKKKENGE